MLAGDQMGRVSILHGEVASWDTRGRLYVHSKVSGAPCRQSVQKHPGIPDILAPTKKSNKILTYTLNDVNICNEQTGFGLDKKTYVK